MTKSRTERYDADCVIILESSFPQFVHVQYIGCTLVVGPKLIPGRGERVVESLLKAAPRSNKRRVTLTITPEGIYVTDMMYRVCAGTLSHSSITTVVK